MNDANEAVWADEAVVSGFDAVGRSFFGTVNCFVDEIINAN